MHEETISTKRIYQGRRLGLRDDTVKLENGVVGHREVCEHPGAVAVIAVTPESKFVLVKQFRQPLGKEIYEIPAGLFKSAETLERAAARELEEETGYRAGQIEKMLSASASPGYSTEILHYFLAADLKMVEKQNDRDEHTEVFLADLALAHQMIKEGRIEDNKTLVGILYYERFCSRVS